MASDAEGAHDLARDAGQLLLRLSAYDYALAGTLSGQRTHVVGQERYAQVVQTSAANIQRFTGAALTATLNAAGPLRDRIVALADGLVDLSRDANAFADGGDPAVFARVIAGVARGWEDLRQLHRLVKPVDEELTLTIQRGTSFAVAWRAERVYAITVGPFADAGDADAAAQRIGAVEQVGRAAPFVVRVGTYADKAAAAASQRALSVKGFTGLLLEEERYTFARSGPAPAAELWREPERVFDTWGNARRVSVAPNATWVATGSDDGTVAIFTGDGILRSLPTFNAGVAHLAFSDDGRWLMGGGLTLVNFILPPGTGVGVPVRLPSPATELVYIPTAYAFAAAAKGPTGQDAGGTGVVAGRAPDGAPLREPFPLPVVASGASLAATAAGELFVAQTIRGATEVQVFRVGREQALRGVVRIPGALRDLAIDRAGAVGAAVTDEGVFRFGPKDTDPARTVKRIADSVRDLAFGRDGTLYLLTQTRISAHDLKGDAIWSSSLVDGRRLVIASRPVVLDGADRLVTFAEDGTAEDLGISGTVQDVAASPDGGRVAVLQEGRRALLFKLPSN